MDQLSTSQLIAVWILPLIFAITLHEVAHGWVASKFGDKTALIMGRLTLNPLKHIDPLGTIVFPGILLLFHAPFIFGWAKPVPVNWHNLRNPKRDMAFVALAGPITNLLMALFWAAIAKLGLIATDYGYTWALALQYMGIAGILINLMLLFLNLIPLPPLDGSRVVSSLLPGRLSAKFDRIEPFGFWILLLLLIVGVLQAILIPPVMLLLQLIVSAFGLHEIGMLGM